MVNTECLPPCSVAALEDPRRNPLLSPSLGPLPRLHLGHSGRRRPADPPRHPHHPLGQHAQQGGPAADHPGGGAVAARRLHHHAH